MCRHVKMLTVIPSLLKQHHLEKRNLKENVLHHQSRAIAAAFAGEKMPEKKQKK